jgi:uncharacterized membrane protein
MTSDTARVEAFSDGVFAIAITLLILEIKVPAPRAGDLAGQLLRQWPSYLSFVCSFAFIGIMWVNHHRMFTHIQRCDDRLLIFNLLLLLGVTVVPFPTSILAAHLGQPDQRTALLLYNATYFCIGIFFNLLWRSAASPHRRLLATDIDREAVERLTWRYAFGPALYLICGVLGWFNVPASLAMNLLLAAFFAIPVVHDSRSAI